MSKKPDYRRAVGLSFSPSELSSPEADATAPRVLVSGSQLDADYIVRIAQKYGIPVVEKPAIAEVLSQIPLDAEIPPELYQAVATILTELERKG